eukprot:scaffold8762_cov104-Cylindrotheca_fusiformis.AAC.1
MNLALKEARAAEDIGEVPIGAIVVERAHDGTFNVVSAAHNLVETTHDASAHAELLALRKASKRARNWRLVNATLYSTLEPCPMCLAAAQAFRISSIVYGAPDIRLGAIKTHIKLLEVDHPYHTIGEVIPDVLGEESASMLRSFFRGRRKSNSKSRPSISLPRKLKQVNHLLPVHAIFFTFPARRSIVRVRFVNTNKVATCVWVDRFCTDPKGRPPMRGQRWLDIYTAIPTGKLKEHCPVKPFYYWTNKTSRKKNVFSSRSWNRLLLWSRRGPPVGAPLRLYAWAQTVATTLCSLKSTESLTSGLTRS